MANYIDNFAASTRRILADGIGESNDFANLAIAGEQLRRACVVGEPSSHAEQALQSYDQFLSAYQGDGAEQLAKGIADALADFQSYAETAPSARDIEEGQDLLLELDELLSVAAAGVRAGLLERSAVEEWAATVQEPIDQLASSVPELAQFAEDREVLFGPDPELPEVYGWWESVAENAPTRMALQATVVSSLKRKNLIGEALAKFDAEHAPSMVASLVERLRERLRSIATPFLVQATNNVASQASYADTQKIPSRVREVIPGDDFSVLSDDSYLIFSVREGHSLSAISVTINNKSLDVDTLDAASFRVALPADAGAILVTLCIDDEELTLPAIDYRERP